MPYLSLLQDTSDLKLLTGGRLGNMALAEPDVEAFCVKIYFDYESQLNGKQQIILITEK